MDPFLEKFFPVVFRRKNSGHQNNYCKYDNQGLSAFTSSLYLAGLVSSLFASPVTRNYGRRASIVCGGISFLIGAILNVAAVNLAMLILGRIMLGVGIGFGNQVCQLLLLCCHVHRGRLCLYCLQCSRLCSRACRCTCRRWRRRTCVAR
jgi:MFS family permease